MQSSNIRSHVNTVENNYGLSILASTAFSFALNTVFRNSTVGCVAGVAAAINGLVNPLLAKAYKSRTIDFWHDLAYKVAILIAAKAVVSVAVASVANSALIAGTIALFILRGYLNDFKPVNLYSSWIVF